MFASYLRTVRGFGRDMRLYLVSISAVGAALFGISSVLLNLYLIRLGFGPEFIGQFNAAPLLASMVFSLPAGALGTRLGYRTVMSVGLGVLIVGWGLLPLADTLPASWRAAWLLVTSTVAFIGGGAYMVNTAPYVMHATTPEERGHAFGVALALQSLAGFGGCLIGGLLPGVCGRLLGVSLDQATPYRYALWGSPLVLIVGMLALLATHKATPPSAPTKLSGADGRTPWGVIALFALAAYLLSASSGGPNTFLNVYLDRILLMPTAQIGSLRAVGQLAAVPASLVATLAAVRWGRRRTVAWGYLGTTLSLLPLALVTHWAAASLGFMGASVFFAVVSPVLTLYGQESVSPRWRGPMAGVSGIGMGLGMASISFGGGYIVEGWGYVALFLLCGGLAVGGALLIGLYLRAPRATPGPRGASEGPV